MKLTVATWNVQWATPASRRTPEILRRLSSLAPDVVCLTESDHRLLERAGHTVCSQPDYGYALKIGRRKVVLWSREPWREVDNFGINSLPPGRFVSGVTRTAIGEITVVGICIPWSGSRTEANRHIEHRARWQDHEYFLAALADMLHSRPIEAMMVMGDFNQVIGQGSRAPRKLRAMLIETFPPTMTIVSSEVSFAGRKSIDHIALSKDLTVESLKVISNIQDHTKLSDHFGVTAKLTVKGGEMVSRLGEG